MNFNIETTSEVKPKMI